MTASDLGRALDVMGHEHPFFWRLASGWRYGDQTLEKALADCRGPIKAAFIGLAVQWLGERGRYIKPYTSVGRTRTGDKVNVHGYMQWGALSQSYKIYDTMFDACIAAVLAEGESHDRE